MSYNDTAIRRLMTPPCAALLAAYERGTRRTVPLDHMRVTALFSLAQRDVTPNDIATVIRYVRRRMSAKDRKRGVGQYSEASLQFMNLLGDAGKFQDTLITAREELAAKRRAKSGVVTVTHPDGTGGTITRLEPEPERAPLPMRDALRAALGNIMEGLA